MSSSIRPGMTFTDYLGFASMTILLVGAVNWGVVAIRYAANDVPDQAKFTDALAKKDLAISFQDGNVTGHQMYGAQPTPDLLDVLGAGPDVQMFIYWTVFASGLFYFGLFIWNSIELRTVEA